MTSRGDSRTSIRSLDPVDPSAPPPDGSRLLQTVLATPVPATRRDRGSRLLQLAAPALGLALVAGMIAVFVAGGERGTEQEAVVGSGGAAIVHYVVRESWTMAGGSPQPAVTTERWQLDDGSRARTVSHWEGEGPLQGKTSEEVVTSTQTLSYLPASEDDPERIIRYRASDDFAAIPEEPPAFAAPPIGGSPAVGDPRDVPDRLAAGDEEVTQLADAVVRDIAVKRFQVGECGEPDRTGRASAGQAPVTLPQRAIVALARDTLTPVRVTHEICRAASAPSETRNLDYISFELLAPTPDNLRLLELSPHPGIPIVDGIEIDKAEERLEDPPAPTPTPTPTPDGPRSGG